MGRKFYLTLKRSIKPWLQDNEMKMYSTNNEGKSVVAERFIGIVNEWNSQIYDFNIKNCISINWQIFLMNLIIHITTQSNETYWPIV